jgi:hypothetical protein
MDQIDKGPDPENFTKDVEIAIDRLFNAPQQIEIDPLANKPREVPQEEKDQKELEDSEEIVVSDIEELGPDGETKDAETDEGFWDLDSELELEGEVDDALDLEQQTAQPDQPTETKDELESSIVREGPDSTHETGQDLGDIPNSELEIEEDVLQQPVPSSPGSSESDRDSLVSTIGSHIRVLDECIAQISPVEDLFAQTPGMEKLCRFQQKIKDRLESQREILAKALVGDYSVSANMSDITQATEDTEPETEHEEKGFPIVSVSCPWQRLVTARWAGRPVAFVPEEVAFCGTLSWWAKRGLEGAREFQLKRLKTWPWSRLQPLIRGELANMEERQLQGLEFPIVQSPGPSSDYYRSPDNPIILVLYRENEGRVLILDTRLETIFLVPESSWEASVEGKESWAGQLKIEKESISVLTMESLLISESNG